jgi:hypothetical protein
MVDTIDGPYCAPRKAAGSFRQFKLSVRVLKLDNREARSMDWTRPGAVCLLHFFSSISPGDACVHSSRIGNDIDYSGIAFRVIIITALYRVNRKERNSAKPAVLFLSSMTQRKREKKRCEEYGGKERQIVQWNKYAPKQDPR